MSKVVLFLLLILSLNVYASPLEEYCKADPTGELYSAIIDADIVDHFETIGLDANNYSEVISANEDLDLFDIAELTRNSHPEILNALQIWKLKTCITRGYRMMHGLDL